MIHTPPKPQVAMLLMIFLAVALALWTWQQGYYAVYTLAVFAAGYFLYPLALSLDTHERRSTE